MNNDSSSSVELNYEMVILKHLDRISASTTFNVHEDSISQPKYDVLEYEIALLEKIIPTELKDKEFTDNLCTIFKNYNEKHKDVKNKPKDISLPMSRLNNCIDLLARKGMLYARKGSGQIGKNKQNKSEPTEVWES